MFLLALFTMSGCQKNEHRNQFAGHWAGTYTGTSDAGTWDFTVDQDGYLTGNVVSVTFGQTSSPSGFVSESGQATVLVTIGTTIAGASFTGNMSGNSVSGNWINTTHTPAYTGTWTGSKL